MEDQHQLLPISSPDPDPITTKKHAAMLERLSDLHNSRLQQSISRKSDSTNSSAPPAFESTQLFLQRFSQTKEEIDTQLNHCRSTSNPDDKSHLKSDLENVSLLIADLEKLVADNSYFLPSYEVRSSLKSIAELKESLEFANSELVPKKRFAFKNKTTKKENTNVPKEIKPPDLNSIIAEKSNFLVPESPGFRNQENSVLLKDLTDLKDGDFMLSDLKGCRVYLKGRLRALFIHHLTNCEVFVGPVMGSILIEEVEGCLFMLASHQIRIHEVKKSDFYLRVRSTPIIEDSSGVRFAPYNLFYEGIEKELRDSDLGDETGNWANVDDFRWLSTVKSPNWCILPEEERISTVNIGNVETESVS